MQVVIKISEREWKEIVNDKDGIFRGRYFDMIRDGTPLPNGHGDLVDRDALENAWHEEFLNGMSISSGMLNTFRDAPIIIEADK